MPKGQPLSRHQQKIVGRYYDHKDAIMATKLAELVTELYLCETDKKAQTLWKRAETALKQTGLKPADIERVTSAHDVPGLAELVKKLNAPG
jgi:cobalamin biosynthesis protein CbiG